MKKILLSLTAVGLIAGAAAPAAAQSWRDHDRHDRYEARHESYRGGRLTTSYVDSLEWKINNAAREGRISRGEARELRREFHQVQPLAWRVQTGEANRWEVARLERTVDRIEDAVGRRGGRHDRRDWRR